MTWKFDWRFFAGLTCALAIYVTLVVAAAQTRKPWNDEAMAASSGWNLAKEGHTGVYFNDPKSPWFPGIHKHTYYIFPFQLVTLSGWFRAAGFSLLSMRVLSLLWTILLLFSFYSLIRMLTRQTGLALLATGIAAVDYHLMLGASFGRYDTMVAALGISGYAIYLYLREKHFHWALLLSQTCIAMSGMTHPNGFLYFLGLAGLTLFYDRKRISWREIALVSVPYLIGVAFWARFISEDFASFKGQLGMNSGGRIGLLRPVDSFLRELDRYRVQFGLGPHSLGNSGWFIRLKAVSLFAYVIGIAGCWFLPALRSRPGVRILLAMTALHAGFLAFWESYKFSFYLIHALPLYGALLAYLCVYLWQQKRLPRWLIAGALSLVVLVQLAGIAAKIRTDDFHKSYLPAVEFLRQRAQPGDLVAAACSFGFDYGFDRNLLDDPFMGYFNGKAPDYVVLEEVYLANYPGIRKESQERYDFAMNVINRYELIYDQNLYKIYKRR